MINIYKRTAAFAVILFLVFSANTRSFAASPVKQGFDPWEIKKTNDANKVWTVKFSHFIEKQDLGTYSIYVTDERNSVVPVTLDTTSDGTGVAIAPVSPYVKGKEYRIYITDNVKSKDGLKLKKPVVVPFIVDESTSRYLLDTKSKYNSLITTIDVRSSSGIYSVKVDGVNMQYLGDGRYTIGRAGLKQGSTVKIQAYDSNGKLLESIDHKI